jgi:hypothetical protein
MAALGAGCLMLFAIAGTAGWLSFAAQRGYAHSRNGGDWSAATGFALLLDAGTLGLSLFRFFEALTLRSSALTRLLLIAFVGASAQMNYLHAPANASGVVDFGSRFVAVVPPLVYAVLLEMLLFKVEQVIMGKKPKRRRDRERGYSLLLWLPFVGYPGQMWSAWRADLHSTLKNVRAPGSLTQVPSRVEPHVGTDAQDGPASAATLEQPPAQAAPGAISEAAAREQTEAEAKDSPSLDQPVEGSLPLLPPSSKGVATATAVLSRMHGASRDALPEQMAGDHEAFRARKPPSMKDLLLEGLIEEMRQGVWDAISEDLIARKAAWVRVNARLGQARGRATLMAHDSARNAFREITPDLHRAAGQIRSGQEHRRLMDNAKDEPARAVRTLATNAEERSSSDQLPQPVNA